MVNLNISITNKKIKKLVNINLLISFFVCIIALVMLWIHYTYYISIYLFRAGIVVYRIGLLISVFSIMYGIFFEHYLDIK